MDGFALLVWAILGVGGILLYVYLAVLVGRAAARKGRSEESWALIALVFGVLIPAVIVAAWRPFPRKGLNPMR